MHGHFILDQCFYARVSKRGISTDSPRETRVASSQLYLCKDKTNAKFKHNINLLSWKENSISCGVNGVLMRYWFRF